MLQKTRDDNKCDYFECAESLRIEDVDIDGRKYCEQHGAELDAILFDAPVSELLNWWVMSHGGAERLGNKILHDAKN